MAIIAIMDTISTITHIDIPINTSIPPNSHMKSLITSQMSGIANTSINAIRKRLATNLRMSPIMISIKY